MTLSELLNPTFFLFLGILLLTLSFLIFYFENKMRDQNHKFNSMFSLISSITEELNNVNTRVHYLISGGKSVPTTDPSIHTVSIPSDTYSSKNMDKIEISDDSEGDEDDSEGDEDDSEGDEEESEGDEEESEGDEDDSEGEDEKTHYKGDDLSLPDLEELNDLEEENKKILVEELQLSSLEEWDIPPQGKSSLSNDFKSIHISLEPPSSSTSVDYKKLSVNQLRNLVIEKGFILPEEAHKLKKNDLYKLLGEPKGSQLAL